jgi:hypothetical protein
MRTRSGSVGTRLGGATLVVKIPGGIFSVMRPEWFRAEVLELNIFFATHEFMEVACMNEREFY